MDYIQRFHNLHATTSAEHHRNFNTYLRDISNLSQNELNSIFEQIAPKNLQEQIFHLKLLLQQRATYNALQSILFQGNKILNKKLTGDSYFLKQLAQIPPTDFCDKICPEISYVSRTRILNRLADVITCPNLGEQFFAAVNNRYGVRVASKLLSACSDKFILKTVNEYEIRLDEKQLISIHEKYPKFVCAYFNEEHDFGKHYKLAQYLALKDATTLFQLIKRGLILPMIGGKASLNFIKQYKVEVIENLEVYKRIISPRIANSVFTLEEYISFYTKLLPDNIDNYYISHDNIKYLRAVPLKVRGNIFFTAFKNYYGVNYDYLEERILEIITQKERLKFKLNAKFCKFLPASEAMKLIKDKIRLTSDIVTRQELVETLLHICKYTRDNNEAALLEFLKYFSIHHKNDITQIRHCVISYLESFYKLAHLSPEHWKYINDIIRMEEITEGNNWIVQKILELRIHHKFLFGLNYLDDVPKLLRSRSIYAEWSIDVPIIARRECVLKSVEHLNSFTNNKVYSAALFFRALVKYNSTRKCEPIPIFNFEDIINLLMDDFKRNRYTHLHSLPYIMMALPQNQKEEAIKANIIRQYFEFCPTHAGTTINLWFLNHNPHIVIANADKYFDSQKFALDLKFYYHANKIPSVANKFREEALSVVNNKSSNSENVLLALRYLAFEDCLLQVISHYRPNEDFRVNIDDDSIADKLVVQKAVIQALCNAPVSSVCVSEMLNYCRGDYLQYGIRALCVVMYNIAEKSIYAPLEVLVQGRISVTEQAIYLLANLSTSQYIRQALTTLGEADEGRYTGKFIFKRTFKGISDYPDDEFFAMLVKHITLIHKDDDESFKMMMQVHKIPRKYQAQYLITVWEHAKVQNLQFDILPMIQIQTWNKLPRVVCESIIKSSLFKENNKFQMETLIYEYVLNEGNFNVICNLDCATERDMFGLLQDIITKILNDKRRKEARLQLVTRLLKSLPHIPLHNHKYPLEILFESCKFLLEIESNDVIAPLVDFIVQKQELAVQIHGPQVTGYFREFAFRFLKIAIATVEANSKSKGCRIIDWMLEVAEKIADSGDAPDTKLLALHLVPRKKSKENKFVEKRKMVLEKILSNSDSAVQISLASAYYSQNI